MAGISEQTLLRFNGSDGDELAVPHDELFGTSELIMLNLLRFDLKLVIQIHRFVDNIVYFQIADQIVLFKGTNHTAY